MIYYPHYQVVESKSKKAYDKIQRQAHKGYRWETIAHTMGNNKHTNAYLIVDALRRAVV